MAELERGPLRVHTPCCGMDTAQLAAALAVVHVELILIHPFRDGNGRTARLVAILMAAQAGMPPLDFSGVRAARRAEYFLAVRVGLSRDYAPMERVFAGVLRRTWRRAAALDSSAPKTLNERGPRRQCAHPRSRLRS
jgi:cell filamentation protein